MFMFNEEIEQIIKLTMNLNRLRKNGEGRLRADLLRYIDHEVIRLICYVFKKERRHFSLTVPHIKYAPLLKDLLGSDFPIPIHLRAEIYSQEKIGTCLGYYEMVYPLRPNSMIAIEFKESGVKKYYSLTDFKPLTDEEVEKRRI